MSLELTAWLSQMLGERGWSFRELGRRTGISPQTIARYANGERVPTPKSCRKVAAALGVPYEEVMRIVGHLPPDDGLDITADELLAMNLVRRAKGKPDVTTIHAFQVFGLAECPRCAGSREDQKVKEN